MVKKVNRVYADAEEIQMSADAWNPKKPGRPPTPGKTSAQIMVTLWLLRTCWQALSAAHEQPAAPSTRKLLASAVQDLLARVGPAIHSEVPVQRRQPGRPGRGYEIIEPDGTTTFHQTVASAAKAMGKTEKSLAVGLSKGGGTYKRRVYAAEAQDYYAQTCRRVENGTTPA